MARSWVWFSPPSPPSKAFIEATIVRSLVDWNCTQEIRRVIGEIFWIVESNQHIFQEILFITIGNQKWQGAIPSFIRRAKNRNLGLLSWYWEEIAPRRRSPEARAWNKKYFTAASFSWLILEERRSGIKEYRFNSNPAQTIIQLLDDRTIEIPRIRVKEKRE